MTLLEKSGPKHFQEEHWLSEQERRGRKLFDWVEQWLKARALPQPLSERVRTRALPWTSGWVEGPGTYVFCAAESFGLPETTLRKLSIAANLYWAAADVADDVDDGEEQCGMKPQANDACALLFLASEALLELGPHAVSMGNHFGLRMAVGQSRDLAATNRPSPYDVAAIARDKAGAEVALFLALVAETAGVERETFERLGEALGVLIQTFSDVADVYVAPHSLDLESGKHTPVLAAFIERDRVRADRLLAAPRAWPEVQAALRYEMRDDALTALAGLETPILRAWADARPLLAHPEILEELVQWMLGLVEVSRGALAELERPQVLELQSGDKVRACACRFLAAGPHVEQHRWGLFDRELVVGDLFPTILATAALREAGANWEAGLSHILRRYEDKAWRYYPGQSKIPTDADDTGLILGHLGDALPLKVRQEVVQSLVGGFHAGGIHTWLRAPDGDIEWEGDDCVATLSNAAWGLLRVGEGAAVPSHVWARLLRHAASGDFNSPFYTPAGTRFFVHRCLAFAYSVGFLEDRSIRMVRNSYRGWYAERRRWGGATDDSLLTTAFNALTAIEWGILPAGDLNTYFATRQDIDGSWAAEPLFMIPGVNYRPVRWGHAALTTSFVMFTLQRLG